MSMLNNGDLIAFDDNDLSANEFALLQEAYKEALLIKDGIIKGIPVAELWDNKM